MPVRTITKLHLATDSSSSECTPPNPQTIDDSSVESRARLAEATEQNPDLRGYRFSRGLPALGGPLPRQRLRARLNAL